MFGGRITLFKLMGFEVRVDASWIILAFLITWTLAVGYFPYQDRGLPQADYWWMGVAAALGLFLSIVVHEFAHSVVARHRGLPMEGITLFIFGGVAEMSGEPPNAQTEFLMAAAGPLTSILIGFIFYGIYRAAPATWPRPVVGVIHYLGWLNWVLAVFNSIPAFPLDGGRVLRSAIWNSTKDLTRATRISAKIGEAFGIVLIALGIVQLFFGNFVSAVWWFILGLFLKNAAQQSYQQLVLRSALAGQPISRFMRTDPVTVPPNISIDDLINDYIYRYHFKMFPVVSEAHQLNGCISTNDVKSVPREEWRQHSVQEMMRPCSIDNTISPDADAVAALTKMSKTGLSRLLVVDHGRLVAILALKDLLDFLSLKLDMEGPPRPRQA
ncbi:MAG TPA: site-2 protease family protein [Bryobacteraceae bacterium]|nr:site-2 protease family protein [Bryobacteraceae bacterium]